MTDKRKASPTLLPVNAQRVRDALSFIPPSVERDTWVRLGMAIKAELGADGFEPWDAWSQQADEYNATDARDTWRSLKAGGAVTIATLFGIAKEHGYRPNASADACTPLDEAATEREAAARQQRRDAEEASYRARADEAVRVARSEWAAASEKGCSAYLKRKAVGAHGVRFQRDGTLLVPMLDAAGELQNLQRIASIKPDGDRPEKRFLPGGRKSGMWHQIGAVDGAPVLLLAEGYATAATLHEATGRPVAVAFDAGNLVHVAKALRVLHPSMPLLVCGDDDMATEAGKGTNPGRLKAAAAARAAGGDAAPAGAVFPAGLPEGGSDFNDLAAHAGADAVRELVDAAVAGLKVAPRLVATSPQARKAGKTASGDGNGPPAGPGHGGTGDGAPGGGSGGTGEPPVPDWDAFSVTDVGVWHTARDAEGNNKKPQWICSRLDVTARTRSDDANGWGALLHFKDPDGNAKAWAMPSAMLSGDGAEWAGRLRDMGLRMAPGSQARNLVSKYLDTRNPQDRVTCTDRVGWHGPVYVLPSASIAAARVMAEGRRYVFQTDTGMEDTFRRLGTLQQWQAAIGAPCVGNSRLVFAVCCAFAGPMLRLAEIESGGVHFRGGSSQGKTTALRVATSVWGRPGYMQRWLTTSNALEATAVQHSDSLLVLDEIGQLDPNAAGNVAYMLANEAEKSRNKPSGLNRKRRTWKLLFLSSGEVSLAQHMQEAGKAIKAGQEVRMIDIPLDAGAGMGGLEVLHGFDRPAKFADALVSAATRCYGTPGRAWLEWACEHFDALPARLHELIERYREDMVPEAAAEQVRRVGTRFALISAAGELASEAGITGWPAGQSAWAARECFNAWIAARGHIDNFEPENMVRQVRRFLEAHAEGRFTWFHRAMDDHAPKTLNRAGFRRLLDNSGKPLRSASDHVQEYGEKISLSDAEKAGVDYLVHREVFEREVCQGLDARAVAEQLKRCGHLVHEEGRLTIRHRLPGIGKAPVYHIRASIFDDAAGL